MIFLKLKLFFIHQTTFIFSLGRSMTILSCCLKEIELCLLCLKREFLCYSELLPLPCRVNEYSHWINLHEQVDRDRLRCQDLMTHLKEHEARMSGMTNNKWANCNEQATLWKSSMHLNHSTQGISQSAIILHRDMFSF